MYVEVEEMMKKPHTVSINDQKHMMNLIFREYPPVGALVRAPGSQNINIEVQEPNSYSNTRCNVHDIQLEKD